MRTSQQPVEQRSAVFQSATSSWITNGEGYGLSAIRVPLSLTAVLILAVLGSGCTGHKPPLSQVITKPTCERVITANVVALDQVYYYNRFGAFNPAGIMYALRRDVVKIREGKAEGPEVLNGDLDGEFDEVSEPIPLEPSLEDLTLAGHVKLRSDKRPRPLVLRANEGDCLRVTFTNLLSPVVDEREFMRDPERRLTHPEKPVVAVADSDEPATRHASMHINGLSLVDSIDSQGANVGRNGWHAGTPGGSTIRTDGRCSTNPQDFGKDLCALAAPGETRTYIWYAKKEGTFFFYSMGAPAGGEGDGGQVGLGLFGAVNVQPKGAKWYRSQVTAQELKQATTGRTKHNQPIINYEATIKTGLRAGDPILNMLKCQEQSPHVGWNSRDVCGTGGELVSSDLNAVIDIDREQRCEQMGEGNACGKPYREFTVIFHDEVTAVQAFDEIREENSPLSSLRDGMGINYGASGVGSMVVANRNRLGPARDCVECKLEEFFLTSWVNGDPAMVVGYEKDSEGNLIPVTDKSGKPMYDSKGRPLFKKQVKYPDDPSNVHHSYLGDPVRFRNMHAGPKETHVFHLHAHQWVEDKHDPQSHYLDSQTISPGATFSYEVHYGGSGNRNLGPGDSIFHCHLYPHFAQGMWELWRTHDVFEDGTEGLFDPRKHIGKDNDPRGRNLPDAEIEEGTPTPAIVPLPHTPLAPMPLVVEKIADGKKIVDDSKSFLGYPFYIAGQKGHRPPQPPLDLDGRDDHGTLRRHIITDGRVHDADKAHGPQEMRTAHSLPGPDLYNVGRKQSAEIASKVWSRNTDVDLISLARELDTALIDSLPHAGTDAEKAAMKFHAGTSTVYGKQAVRPGDPGWNHTPYNWEAPGYSSCLPDGRCDDTKGTRVLFRVNGGGNIGQDDLSRGKQPGDGISGAPFSNPCPKQWVDENGTVRDVVVRKYRAVYLQMDMTVNKSGWHDPQARFPVLEEDVKDTLNGSRPTEPLFFRAQSGECIEFYATNLIPSNLNLDDFQAYSPTDVIGQHIHLVKFDVTSSDGSGNGWNYEDGTLAADEVRERIVAYNRRIVETTEPNRFPKLLEPKTHPLFLTGGAMFDPKNEDKRGICPKAPMVRELGESNEGWSKRWEEWGQKATREHPWCGAQTTIQRWWADPVLNQKPGEKKTKDRTLRTVFTHDHFGPSSHQQHGFYAALVVEPRNSKWYFPDGRLMGGTDVHGKPEPLRSDGGPTSYAANIIVREQGKACITPAKDGIVCSEALDANGTIDHARTGREFNLAFADFAIVYDKENQPINPPSQIEGGLAYSVLPGRIPMPEGISTKDPGTQLINYRNEPIPLRIGRKDEKGNQFVQLPTAQEPQFSEEEKRKPCSELGDEKRKWCEEKERGDLANVFSSKVHKDQPVTNAEIFTEGGDRGRQSGDPATPLLRAYEGDHVQIRLIQGAQEEQHVFTLHGAKWLAQPDSQNTGYVGAQHLGISEHFEFNDRVVEFMPSVYSSDGPSQVDHLYMSNAADNFWDGQWGLMRVYPRTQDVHGLVRLPGNTEKTHDVLASASLREALTEALDNERLEVIDGDKASAQKPDAQDQNSPKDALEAFCRTDEQQVLVRNYVVQAWLAKDLLPEGKLVYNRHFGIADPNAIMFVEAGDVSNFQSGSRRPEPLILRARAGECIRLTLENKIQPAHHADGSGYPETWSYNMVPPITPGLSFNQVRTSHRVGLHPQLVDYNLQASDGAYVGLNSDSTVGPGERRTYLWYAGEIVANKKGDRIVGIPHEFGAIPLQDMGDVIKHASHGAIGALVIEPQCSKWTETVAQTKAEVEVVHWRPEQAMGRHGKLMKRLVCPETEPTPESGLQYRFKEMVLLYQDNLSVQQYGQPLPNLRNGDDSEDSGQKAFNYRTEPLWARLGATAADEPETMNHFDWSNVLSSTVSHFRCEADFSRGRYCDPETPIFTAKAGEQVRLRIVHSGGHPRQHGFTAFGHDWSLSPWIDNSRRMGWNQSSSTRVGSTGGIGPGRAINIMASAGGDCAVPGDYLYRTQEGFMFGGGLWGILRVEDNTSPWYHYFDWQKERWGDHKIEGDSKRGCSLPQNKSLTP